MAAAMTCRYCDTNEVSVNCDECCNAMCTCCLIVDKVDKSDKTKERMRLIFLEERRKLDFNRKFAQPSPDFPEPKIRSKQNAASLLRSGEIITKQETENLRKLEALLEGDLK